MSDDGWEFSGSQDDSTAEPSEPVASAEPVAEDAAPVQADADEADAETADERVERERNEHGQFRKSRHRARSQQASAEDVPRIRNLTAKNRELEAEIQRLKAPVAAPAPAQAAPIAQRRPMPAPEPHRVQPSPSDKPKPLSKDFEDYDAFTEALQDWKIEQRFASERTERQRQADHQRQMQAARTIDDQFAGRMNDALKKYPDFQTVIANPPWIHAQHGVHPDAILLDAYIRERPGGPDVLYYLRKHPDELAPLLRMRGVDGPDIAGQYAALTLLEQRIGASSRPQDGTTGASAPRTTTTSAPRPPTPVRTAPQRSSDEPPGDDASFDDHARAYHPRSSRVSRLRP